MTRSCNVCQRPYEAKRATSKYCGVTCRTRASRAGTTEAVVADLPTPSAGLEDALTRELDGAGRLDTWLGQSALELARRISSPHESGASIASLTKQLRETMADALKGAATADDALDELRKRRDSKRAAG